MTRDEDPTSNNGSVTPRASSSPEAEAQVVAAVLTDGAPALRRIPFLGVQHFHSKPLRSIFQAAITLAEDGQPVDPVTVTDALRSAGKLERAGGSAGISAAATTLSTDGLEHYAKMVYSHAMSRDLLDEARSIVKRSGETDPDELLATAATRVREIEANMRALNGDQAAPVRTFGDVAGELGGVEWFWPGWIPKGFITLIAGTDGVGKSLLALRLIQSVTAGTDWPDGTHVNLNGSNREACYVDTEGSHGLNFPRLRAMGVPEDAVFWPLDPRRPDENMPEIYLDDRFMFAQFEKAVRQRRPALIVLDAFRGLFRGDENSSRDTWFLKPIAAMCRDLHMTCIIFQHVTKRKPEEPIGVVTMDAIRGSTAIRQVCRSIIAIDQPDPGTEERRVRVLKLNLARRPAPIGYLINHDGMPVFSQAPPDIPQRETAVDRAEVFLRDILKHGEVPAKEIEEQAKAAALSIDSVRRASKRIQVVIRKHGIPGQDGGGLWTWSLPGAESPQHWSDR